MDIDRRGFLKGIATIGILLVVPKMDFILPNQEVLTGLSYIGNIRVLSDYDIESDKFILRYDVFNKKTQLYIIREIPEGIKRWDLKDFRNRIHNPMIAALNNEIQRRKMLVSDLVKLPSPPGYMLPEWYPRMIGNV